jgi:hypothetical protein
LREINKKMEKGGGGKEIFIPSSDPSHSKSKCICNKSQKNYKGGSKRKKDIEQVANNMHPTSRTRLFLLPFLNRTHADAGEWAMMPSDSSLVHALHLSAQKRSFSQSCVFFY